MATVLLFARSCRALSTRFTGRLLCCLCFSKWHSSVMQSTSTSEWWDEPGGFDPGGDYHNRQKLLWTVSFTDSSKWSDNMLDKKSFRHPDLRHKGSQTMQRSLLDYHEVRSLCEAGHLDYVLDMLVQQGTVPSVNVLSIFLKACAKQRALPQVKRFHVYLTRHGLESTNFLGACMVSTLVKCGGLEDALQLFHRLPNRSAFSWTAVLSGYTSAGLDREALGMYHWMRMEGVEPDKYTLVTLLRACGSLSDLKEGRRIHAEASKYRLQSDPFVGTCLVDMYAKCGSMVDAATVFDGLPQRNVVTWTVMLGAYAQQGQADKALQLYDRMQEDGVSPNDRTFVTLLQACRILAETADAADGQSNKARAFEKGIAIHADSRKKGYDADVFVGNTLVSMYGKCGSMAHARNVFDGLTQRDVISWNAMLGAYLELGQSEKALQLYDRMHEEHVSPNERTFVSALQACGVLSDAGKDALVDSHSATAVYLEKGRAIHADLKKKGYDSSIFIGSTLISVYGKCRSILDAENVFDGLFQRNIVSWNAMLAAYVQCGQAGKALLVYKHMLGDCVSPDIRTFITLLQACGMVSEEEHGVVLDGQLIKMKSLELGKVIHANALRKGTTDDVFIGNTLVSMYGKCGSTLDAQNVFDQVTQRDVVSWTAMLSAFTQQGKAEKALELFEQMSQENVKPDVRIFATLLQICVMLADQEDDDVVDGRLIKVKALKLGKAMHAHLWWLGYRSDVIIGNTLVSMYGKCGSILDALYVFNGLPHQDVVSWNAMLASYAQQGPAEKVMELYERMSQEGVSPDVWTFVSLLQACGILAEDDEFVVMDGKSVKAISLHTVKAFHADICLKGYDQNVFIGNTLVSMYGKCGDILDAESVFAHLSLQDVVSWNALLGAYAQQGLSEKAFQLFEQMTEAGVYYDDITVMSILQACSNTGNLVACRQIHHILLSTGNHLTSLLASTLIHSYGSCASMVDAQSVFEALPQPDVVVWTALIAGYARQGNATASSLWYEKMRQAGVKPDSVTFLSLLSACSHEGLVDKGIEYFESMSRDYGITPGMEHYVSMVDLLGRAGDFARLEQLLSSLPMQPDRAMLSCLLGACQKHGKVALGKHAFTWALHLQPYHAAPYVLMSNIYEAAGLGGHAKELKALRQKAGAWKKPGQSWIEHQQEVHSFVAGDSDHVLQEQLQDLLDKVSTG